MKKVLGILVVLIGGYLVLMREQTSSTAPALSYRDTIGNLHTFTPPCKPAAVVFWIYPCQYCEHALKALDTLSLLYSPGKLDVVGLYINHGSAAQVDAFAQQGRHTFPVAATRPDNDDRLIQALDRYGFHFGAPGLAIYIVNEQGKFQKVDASDLKTPSSEIAGKAINVIADTTKLTLERKP